MRIERNELEKLYLNQNNKDTCNQLGITNPTLVSLIKENGIEQKGKGWHLRHRGKFRKVDVF